MISGASKSVGGQGTLGANVTVQGGAGVGPGGSVGQLTIIGQTTLGHGTVFTVEIDDAAGTAGAGSGAGWDLLSVDGVLVIDASADDPIVIDLRSLDSVGDPGQLTNFDSASRYSWMVAEADQISGFDATLFDLDLTDFVTHNALAPDSTFQLITRGNAIHVEYIPEPTTIALLTVGAMTLIRRRCRRIVNV